MKKVIDDFVNSITTMEKLELNLKEVERRIESYKNFGEDIYYNSKKFTLEELYYYKKILLKRQEILIEKEYDWLSKN